MDAISCIILPELDCLVTVLGFLGQSEDGAARVGAVGNLADLVRLFAPGTPDLQERRPQHENLTASRALDLGSFPVDLHYVILNNPVIASKSKESQTAH